MAELCSEDEIRAVTAAVEADPEAALIKIDALLEEFADDARLHFLQGSILIGLRDFIRAHSALVRAIDLAPDFAIARFQLGLFQLTSGEADNALSTWGPLDRLPAGHYLRHFVDGLRHMIRDEFPEAITAFNAGCAANEENLPLNNDMKMLAEECAKQTMSEDDGEEVSSETALLLGQKPRFHSH